MTPRTARHVFGLMLACVLLLCLLSFPGVSAGPASETSGQSSEQETSDTDPEDFSDDDDGSPNAGAGVISTTESPSIHTRRNLSRIIEMAGRESPDLRRHGGFDGDAGSDDAVDDTPRSTSHPSEEIKPIFGGSVTITWLVRVQILSGQGSPVPSATVWIVDGFGRVTYETVTDENGITPPLALIEAQISEDGSIDLNPYTVIVDDGGGTQEFPMMVESDGTMVFVLQIPIEDEPIGAIAYAGVFVAFACCMVAPMTFDRSRYALLAPLVPLYSKLRREDIVGQPTRGLILDYILANPGQHFGAIKKALQLSNGNAVYHLRFLEKQGLIKSKLFGKFRRFYPRDFAIPPDNGDAAWAS